MKKILVILLIGFIFSVVAAAPPPEKWKLDYQSALAEAKKEKKDLFLLFTGSDWCPACIYLRQNILEKDEFKSFIHRRFVPLYLDDPNHSVLSPELSRQRALLSRRFVPGDAVPTAVIVSADEKVLGRIVGAARTPADYIGRINEALKKK